MKLIVNGGNMSWFTSNPVITAAIITAIACIIAAIISMMKKNKENEYKNYPTSGIVQNQKSGKNSSNVQIGQQGSCGDKND